MRNGRVAAAKEAAAAAVKDFGTMVELGPLEALKLVQDAFAGQVAFLQAEVAKIEDGELVTKGDLHPMIRALNVTLEQLRVAAKTNADAGQEERRLHLDELATDGLASYVRAVLDRLELTEEQEAMAPDAMLEAAGILDAALGGKPRGLLA